jgi:hypothetical protein
MSRWTVVPFLTGLQYALASTITHIIPETLTRRAINPTSSGQIGVNPVTLDPAGVSQYVGPIGTDTNILSLDGSTTKVNSLKS